MDSWSLYSDKPVQMNAYTFCAIILKWELYERNEKYDAQSLLFLR